MGKIARLFLMAVIVAAFLNLGYAALSFPNCVDGTTYYSCSTKSPGMRCIGTTSSTSLSRDLTCLCESVPGYITQGTGDSAECVLAKCGSLNSGDCDPNNKPKMCSMGSLVDNATKCGCPTGEVASGLSCSYPPCNDGGTTVANGVCSPKTSGKKCINGALVWNANGGASAPACPCASGLTKVGDTCVRLCDDGTSEGNCSSTKPKQCTNGYLVDNATACGCPSGQVAVGTRCGDAAATGGLGSVNLPILQLSGNGSANTSNQSASTPLLGGNGNGNCCCCLPTALTGIAVGLVFFRKK